AFSPDGTTVLTGSFDNTARLWDVKTGQQLHILQGHTEIVNSVAFNPDGTTVLTGSWDNTAILWDVKTGQQLQAFIGHTDLIYSAAYSPDGKTVLTGSNDKTARLWDVKTGQPLHILQGHTEIVNSVAFSPDGTTVITGSKDNTARLWSVDRLENMKKWSTTVMTPLEAWLISKASQARKSHDFFDVLENSFEHTIFMNIPSCVQEYIEKWYYKSPNEQKTSVFSSINKTVASPIEQVTAENLPTTQNTLSSEDTIFIE
ncbi:WD40 repeat domain-containing protein, partial [Candidatus Dependentiae bacterium]|nr:WD40 repeat domain-containing protein [Candidatus Dependentiae bacterium]